MPKLIILKIIISAFEKRYWAPNQCFRKKKFFLKKEKRRKYSERKTKLITRIKKNNKEKCVEWRQNPHTFARDAVLSFSPRNSFLFSSKFNPVFIFFHNIMYSIYICCWWFINTFFPTVHLSTRPNIGARGRDESCVYNLMRCSTICCVDTQNSQRNSSRWIIFPTL